MLQSLCSQSRCDYRCERKSPKVKLLFGEVDILMRLLIVISASSATVKRSLLAAYAT